jgi:polysaccharide biosynthesis protein PslG
MRKNRRYRRSVTRTIFAITTGIVCVAAIAVAMPSLQQRRIVIAETANINPNPTTIGVADSDIWFRSQADVNKSFDAMLATNVKVVRIGIPWAGVEPVRGQLDWTGADKLVNAAVSRNMAIIVAINSTPAWAVAPNNPPIISPPASMADFADYCARVAQRYKGKISAYEVWNEPNGIQFWRPAPDPAAYTSMLKAAYPKIKAVDARVTVIGGVLGAVADFGTWLINPVTFLKQMYTAGAKGNFDAVSFHPYHYSLKFSDGVGIQNAPVDQLIQMRQTMVEKGDGGKKIWATEYGEPVAGYSEATQSDFIADIMTKWQEMPYTGPLMIYTLLDKNTGSEEDTFGIYRADWSPKPAQQTMKSSITAGPAKSAEYQRFATQTDPAHGTVLSPVFRATPQVWAQMRTVNTLFETPAQGQFIASPNPVAAKGRAAGLIPTGPFANGYQDFNHYWGYRVWYSPATGAHGIGGGIAYAWRPSCGLAISDEVPEGNGVKVTFQNGFITWQPWVGATVSCP